MRIDIRPMKASDVAAVAAAHRAAFPDEARSRAWIAANFRAFPRLQMFVAAEGRRIVGYVAWLQKCGFRAEQLIELEQIGVLPARRGEGIASRLIQESLALVSRRLRGRGAKVGHVLVTTEAGSPARRLYARTLGARQEHVFPGYVAGKAESYMLARKRR